MENIPQTSQKISSFSGKYQNILEFPDKIPGSLKIKSEKFVKNLEFFTENCEHFLEILD